MYIKVLEYLSKTANYNIISRSSLSKVFCEKHFLEISSKVLQTYLWLSKSFVKQQAFNLQLYQKWTPSQVFSRTFPRLSEHSFPEQPFMGSSWQRVPNSPYHPTPPFQHFVEPLFPVVSNLHLHYYFWCLVSLNECVIIPHLICYFT